MLLSCFLNILFMSHTAAVYDRIVGLPSIAYKLEGDINIGGVFPLHQAGHNASFCGPLRELGVLQRAEAMAFYIREINKNDTLLPGIKLGFTILDDCYKETTALARGLQFIPESATSGNKSTPLLKRKEDVVALIGAESSTNSKQLAELLGLFAIPQISYLSTSPILGNRILYPYFSRIVPSDDFQMMAILDLMAHYNWTYISFVYSLSFYGIHGYLLLLEKMGTGRNICLAVTYALPENPSKDDYEKAINQLVAGSIGKPSHVVVLFVSQTAATGMLLAAQKLGLRGKFTWIASDAWGRNGQDFRGVEDIAEGTLTIKLASKNDPSFDQHFANLSPTTTNNPFLKEFWNVSCNDKNRKRNCGSETRYGELADVYKPESTVGLVKIAVYSLAQSLDELLKRCKYRPNRGNISGPCLPYEFRQYISGKDLQQLLHAMEGSIDGAQVSVRMGEGRSRYTIMNYRRVLQNPPRYDLNEIGYYDTQNSTLFMSNSSYTDVYWNSFINISGIENTIPVSICSRECRMGQMQTRLNFYNSMCCWECEDCRANEYTKVALINDQQTYQCAPCGVRVYNDSRLQIFTSATTSNDSCQPIIPQSIDLSDPFGITILAIDIVCVIATIVLLTIYFRNRKQRLIMATSLELSYIIWSGVLFSYISIFAYFMPLQSGCVSKVQCEPLPNMHWCYIQYVTFSLSFTIIIAPMLTRANRIHRIFNTGKKSAIKPKFIEGHYQIMFTAILVLVQIIIIIICGVISHFSNHLGSIQITNYQDEVDFAKSYISCEISISLILPPLIYNFLLGLACAYHAFKTRRLPDNFKESRFIGMTVYTTVIMWIAFIPAYLSINSRYYKGVPLSVAMLINSLITTSCLFVPRLYALRWVEGGRMNLRSLSISLHSFNDKSRRTSTSENSDDRHRSEANGNARNIMAPPDVISTACYQNEAVERDSSVEPRSLNTSRESNSVTFQLSESRNSVEIVQFDVPDVLDYPV